MNGARYGLRPLLPPLPDQEEIAALARSQLGASALLRYEGAPAPGDGLNELGQTDGDAWRRAQAVQDAAAMPSAAQARAQTSALRAAREELLAAQLEIEQLRAALDTQARIRFPVAYVHDRLGHSEKCDLCRAWINEHGKALPHAANCLLSAPPPDLGPLRELVAAITGFDPPVTLDQHRRFQAARVAVLAAYPFLAEPEAR